MPTRFFSCFYFCFRAFCVLPCLVPFFLLPWEFDSQLASIPLFFISPLSVCSSYSILQLVTRPAPQKLAGIMSSTSPHAWLEISPPPGYFFRSTISVSRSPFRSHYPFFPVCCLERSTSCMNRSLFIQKREEDPYIPPRRRSREPYTLFLSFFLFETRCLISRFHMSFAR
jgi:hypothetical protein